MNQTRVSPTGHGLSRSERRVYQTLNEIIAETNYSGDVRVAFVPNPNNPAAPASALLIFAKPANRQERMKQTIVEELFNMKAL